MNYQKFVRQCCPKNGCGWGWGEEKWPMHVIWRHMLKSFFQSFRWQPWSSSTCTFQTLELLMDKPTSTTSNGTTTPLHSPTSKLGEFKHKSYFKVGWVWTQKLLKSWVNLNTKATAKLGKLKHKIHLKEVCTNFLSFFVFLCLFIQWNMFPP